MNRIECECCPICQPIPCWGSVADTECYDKCSCDVERELEGLDPEYRGPPDTPSFRIYGSYSDDDKGYQQPKDYPIETEVRKMFCQIFVWRMAILAFLLALCVMSVQCVRAQTPNWDKPTPEDLELLERTLKVEAIIFGPSLFGPVEDGDGNIHPQPIESLLSPQETKPSPLVELEAIKGYGEYGWGYSLLQAHLMDSWQRIRVREHGIGKLAWYAPLLYPHIVNGWVAGNPNAFNRYAGGRGCGANWWSGAILNGECVTYRQYFMQWGDLDSSRNPPAQVALFDMRLPRAGEDLSLWAHAQMRAATGVYWTRLVGGFSDSKGFDISGCWFDAGAPMPLGIRGGIFFVLFAVVDTGGPKPCVNEWDIRNGLVDNEK